MESLIPSKQQRRNWKGKAQAKERWEENERRVRSKRGARQARRRSEVGERPFGHLKLLGGLGRLWVRGMDEVHKRVLLMTMAFNLSLVMRKLVGFGKPRCFQGRDFAWESLSSLLHDLKRHMAHVVFQKKVTRNPVANSAYPRILAA